MIRQSAAGDSCKHGSKDDSGPGSGVKKPESCEKGEIMKVAVMYGAGSIGRGFMGELFDRSGYETVFIDQNESLIDRLNQAGSYPLCFVSNTGRREIRVGHVRGICGSDAEKIAGAIAQADLMATSVGKGALPKIAPFIAEGIRRRWRAGRQQPLDIIVCENMIHANRYLRELLSKELQRLSANEAVPASGGEEPAEGAEGSLTAYFEQYIGTVETCIGRNVPVMTPELCGDDPLRVRAEEYHLLPVDETTFKGPLPQLAGLEPEPSFEYYIREKLFMYNMAHAVTGYLGMIRGIALLWEAIEEPDIRYVVNKAFTEISRAMAREFDKPLDSLLSYCDSLLVRFHNRLLNIQVPRLAQDPLRKLSPDDRLVGAARLCEKHGVFPAYMAVGIAAGYYSCAAGCAAGCAVLAEGNDPEALALREMIRQKGIDAVITEVSGIRPEEPLFAFVRSIYDRMQAGVSLREIIVSAAEK